MPGEALPTVALNDLVRLCTEKAVGQKRSDWPYVGLEHLESGSPFLSGPAPANSSTSTNGVFHPGDILFGKLRPYLRKSAIVTFSGYCSTDLLVLRPREGVEPAFAAKVFQSEPVFSEAVATSIGTKMPRTSWASLKRLLVFGPGQPEQRHIAEILDTLDDTIRKTEQVVAKLRQIKLGLLHDLLTRGIDERGELRDPERHPEQFKDSPLGLMPRSWDVGALQQWLSGPPKNGYSPQAVAERTGTFMLGLGCLTAHGFEPRQLKNAPLNDTRVRQALLNAGDLLIGRSNTRDLVGLAGVYEDVGQPCIYPDLMMRLSPTEATSARFLEAVLCSAALRRQIQAAACGTSGSMVKISGAVVRRLTVAIPGHPEQGRILDALSRATSAIALEERELSKVRNLKVGLMDDLLTGKVRVIVSKEAA